MDLSKVYNYYSFFLVSLTFKEITKQFLAFVQLRETDIVGDFIGSIVDRHMSR
jgi:hypothetical protein